MHVTDALPHSRQLRPLHFMLIYWLLLLWHRSLCPCYVGMYNEFINKAIIASVFWQSVCCHVPKSIFISIWLCPHPGVSIYWLKSLFAAPAVVAHFIQGHSIQMWDIIVHNQCIVHNQFSIYGGQMSKVKDCSHEKHDYSKYCICYFLVS